MATYVLPASASISGTIQVTVVTDVGGLTVPAFDTLLSLGPKDENLTEDLGVVELATLRFVVRDDTSTHSQGFWYKILDESTDCRIRVQILENGSYNDFFYGVLSKEEIVWTETYLGIPRIRTAEFTVVSIIAKLFDVDMGDFLDDVYDYSTLFDCNPGAGVTTNWKYVIPLGSILGVALKTAGLNSIENSAEFVYDPSYPDLKFLDASNNEYEYNKVYIPTAFWDTGLTIKHEYWNSSSADSLDAIYGGDFKAFLGDFLFNFGFMLRIDYDSTLFQPYLYQRYGRAYSTLITLGSEMESTLIRPSPLRTIGTKVALKSDPDAVYWFHQSREPNGSLEAVPPELEFDVDRVLLWRAPNLGGGGTYHNTESIGVYSGTGGYSNMTQAVNFKYFDAYQAALQATTATTQTMRMQHAIAGYHYKALILQNKSFLRTYSGIAATVAE